MRLATFNVQNMRLRRRNGQSVLDAARDGDVDYGRLVPALAEADRRLTAGLIRDADADVLALQEVFDTAALDFFHDRYLMATGIRPYPIRICLPGNDGRGLNVALLSRVAPLRVRSHAAETGQSLQLDDLPPGLRDAPIFRRDCLEVGFANVTLYICHFKAPYPDAARACAVRRAEARAVRRLIERRFPVPGQAQWIILGDFNEPGRVSHPADPGALAPLLGGFSVDLALRRHRRPDWTFETPDHLIRSRPDRILVSPALARACPDARVDVLHAPETAPGAGQPPPHPSDHALVFTDLPGIPA